jgi:DNA-binding NarL/FixJ family response regulator
VKDKASVLIIDDHPVFRRGLRDIIEESSGFKIVGEASDGVAALSLIDELKPDIVIVDIDMPVMNGLETVKAMQKKGIPTNAIFLTMYNDEDVFNAAMDLNVKAYVLKENAADDILTALESVARDQPFVSRSMSAMKQDRADCVRKLLLSKPQIADLTVAERRILKLIAEDFTSKEIAHRLNISVKTIENHRQNICSKLKIYGSHGLLKFAFEHKSHL